MIEITRFRLAADADEGRFREIDRQVQTDVAYRDAGLLRRTTARGTDGEWVVVETWNAAADADAAAPHRTHHPICTEFLAMVDRGTLRTDRYHTLD